MSKSVHERVAKAYRDAAGLVEKQMSRFLICAAVVSPHSSLEHRKEWATERTKQHELAVRYVRQQQPDRLSIMQTAHQNVMIAEV